MTGQHRTGCTLLICVVLTLLLGAAAMAADVVGDGTAAVGPLQVLDDGALWVSTPFFSASPSVARRQRAPLLLGRPGRAARRVAFVGSITAADLLDYEATRVTALDVSHGHAAYTAEEQSTTAGRYSDDYRLNATAYLIDLRTRERTPFVRCGREGGAETALSWPWLVTTGCRSAQAPGAVEVRDLRAPGSAPTRLAGSGDAIRAVGTLVGWLTPTHLVVRNPATNAEVLRVPRSALPASPEAWTLQADGKVAIPFRAANPSIGVSFASDRIALIAPGSADVRVLNSGGQFLGLRLAGDRFVLERPGTRDALVVRTLAGIEHVVARFAGYTNSTLAGEFDFDGTRAAWVRERCGRREVVVARVDDDTDDYRVDACPLLLRPANARVTTKGRFRVGAICARLSPASLTDSCRVVATIFSRGRGISTIRRRIDAADSHLLQFAPSRRLLRLRPRKIRLRVRTTMRGGTETRRLTVTPEYPPRK